MIVIGADTHKQSHTCAAAKAGTGELAGERTAAARKPGFRELLDWARIARLRADLGARGLPPRLGVVRALPGRPTASGSSACAPKLMGESRKGERARGKSDPIDALAIARAALREGPETLPAAHLDERALELKLLLDHREDLVRSPLRGPAATALAPARPLARARVAGRLSGPHRLARSSVARKLSRAEQRARVRIARELVLRDPRAHPPRLGARARDHRARRRPGAGAACAARLRRPHRREANRRDRRRRALRIRRKARPARRRRPDPGLLGQPQSPPARPRRQPPAQLRPAPDRGHPGPRARARARVPGPQAGRGQVANGGASLPQAPPRPGRLARSSRRPRPRVDQLPLPY